MPANVVSPTSSQELHDQIVLDFFNRGIPIIEAPEDIVLRKSNAAIKMVSPLGLLELKIIDACLFVAKDRMLDNVMHSTELEYFKWLLSFNSQNREHLKKAITKIQQTVIQINIIDDAQPEKDVWHSVVMLPEVGIANGRIYFRISESLRKSLMNPNSWTMLSFRIKNRFTSEYPYRLYERCRANQFRGTTDWWEINDFRKEMNVVDQYPMFQDLNKRVIKPAVDQINEHSDIFITPNYKTRGRSKTHIQFIIEENPNTAKFVEEREKLPAEVFDALKKEFGFSNSEIDSVAGYPLDYLAQKIEFTRYRMKTAKNPINRPNLYLLKALKDDLQFNATEVAKFKNEQQEQQSYQAEEVKKQEKRVKSTKKNELLTAFVGLPENEQERVIETFKKSDFYKPIRNFVKEGEISVENPLIKAAFIQFLEAGAI